MSSVSNILNRLRYTYSITYLSIYNIFKHKTVYFMYRKIIYTDCVCLRKRKEYFIPLRYNLTHIYMKSISKTTAYFEYKYIYLVLEIRYFFYLHSSTMRIQYSQYTLFFLSYLFCE